MEDQRAHKRIDNLELAVAENTALTKQIVANTAELVMLVRGARGLRMFIVWVSPVVLAVIGVWHWFKPPQN